MISFKWLKYVGSIQQTMQKEASQARKHRTRKIQHNFPRNLLFKNITRTRDAISLIYFILT